MKNIIEFSPKKKIFFVLSSLASGGSERVFWSVAQGINKLNFQVSIILLNSKVSCYSTDLDQVRFIDLNTQKASKSFFSLYKLIKEEKPDVVFSTSDHVNVLASLVSRFIKTTQFIARASNIPSEQILYVNYKSKFYSLFSKMSYKAFNHIICQTEYMRESFINDYNIEAKKTVVIPNPVLKNDLLKLTKGDNTIIKLIVVSRFAPEKGLDRLIDIFSSLPSNYHLSMVGKGRLKNDIVKKVERLNLSERVKFYGEINNVQEVMLEHDLFVLGSYTEGCPNVVIEALSVGLPVVAFKVSGMKELIKDGFNGYVVEQNDLTSFKDKIIQTSTSTNWNYKEIKSQVYSMLDLRSVSESYEQLINN